MHLEKSSNPEMSAHVDGLGRAVLANKYEGRRTSKVRELRHQLVMGMKKRKESRVIF